MFWKKRKKEKVKYDICRKNKITLIRVKEHTGQAQPDEPITYENVAIPEIHIRRKK